MATDAPTFTVESDGEEILAHVAEVMLDRVSNDPYIVPLMHLLTEKLFRYYNMEVPDMSDEQIENSPEHTLYYAFLTEAYMKALSLAGALNLSFKG